MKRLQKSTVAALVFLAALMVWIPGQLRLRQARRVLSETQAQLAALDERLAASAAALESAQRDWRAQNASHDQARVAVAMAERELARVDPEVRWSALPAVLPEWNGDSPYVWLRKEIFSTLPVGVFTERGELRREVAMVLTADEAQLRALNTALPRCLADYQALEAATAERIDQHLPDNSGDGTTLTLRIKPLPEERARLLNEFETALRQELGEQRAGLLMQVAGGWLASQFSQDQKIISMTRRPEGDFRINTENGYSKSSVGWRANSRVPVPEYVPSHLLPRFAELLDPAASVGASRTPE